MATLGERLLEALRANLNDLLERARARRHGERDAASTDAAPRGGEDRAVAQAYANLELEPGSDLATAKKQYRRLMARYHPDRHHRDPQKAEVANRLAAELTRAYDTIVAYWELRAR